MERARRSAPRAANLPRVSAPRRALRRRRRDPRARRRVGGPRRSRPQPISLRPRTPSAPAENGAPDGSFAERVRDADAFVHASDVAERDILDGDSTGDAIGGFAAAARKLGATPALYSLDTSCPRRRRRGRLREDIARVVHGRLSIRAGSRRSSGMAGAARRSLGADALFVFAAARMPPPARSRRGVRRLVGQEAIVSASSP